LKIRKSKWETVGNQGSHEVYIAYYILRSDGDGDLFAVVEDGEYTRGKNLSLAVQKTIEQTLSGFGKWFAEARSECDFPDVWDLSSDFVARELHKISLGEHIRKKGKIL